MTAAAVATTVGEAAGAAVRSSGRETGGRDDGSGSESGGEAIERDGRVLTFGGDGWGREGAEEGVVAARQEERAARIVG